MDREDTVHGATKKSDTTQQLNKKTAMRLQAEFHSQSHGIGLKVKGTAERRGAGPQWAQGRGSHTSPQALLDLDQRERSGGGA